MARSQTIQRHLSPFSKLVILSSGIFSIIGWAFFGFGMIFFWAFVMNSEAPYMFTSRDWIDTKGVIVKIEETNMEENEASIYRYIYTYSANRREYTGRSYGRGWQGYSEKSEVPIQYDVNEPTVSKIEGGRLAPFSSWVLFVCIFPLIGLIFILISLRQNVKAVDLLQYGIVTWGKRKSREYTNMKVNEQTVFKYVFTFKAENGQEYEVAGKTHETYKLEDEGRERLIYDPEKPEFAILYDLIPHAPFMDRAGNIEQIPFKRAYTLILPGIVIIGHLTYYVLAYIV